MRRSFSFFSGMPVIVLVGMTCNMLPVHAQLMSEHAAFTHADSLRGSIGPGRTWWDVTHYEVSVHPDFDGRSIEGVTTISFRRIATGHRMQIDLQEPLVVDLVTWGFADSRAETAGREGNVLWVELPEGGPSEMIEKVTIRYHGVPRSAKNPPWDGGWIWKTDEQGAPWMSVACQGLGASVWYPCKDHQSDEPDSASLHIRVRDDLQAIGNGRLRSIVKNNDGTTTWNWAVVNPINSYNLIPYIGKYAHFSEGFRGEEGPLDLDYWVLAANEAKARQQFKQVPLMLKCFEEWLGPYPFYQDGYKLVEAPHLGMEHQSAIAYGNKYLNGYLGMDRSGTGHGSKWDYIIIHESGHEWFGNNITTKDIADMWVHEGITDYTETIYTECQQGKEAGNDYVIGLRRGIANDRPLIGPYGVNQEGSGDMYNKGANLMHTIRYVMNDDAKFKAMLRAMNHDFFHQTVTSAQIEGFISAHAGRDLSRVFDQYLRTTMIPVLEWRVKRKHFHYRWSNCVPGFDLPVKMTVGGTDHWLQPTSEWQALDDWIGRKANVEVDRNWYVTLRKVP